MTPKEKAIELVNKYLQVYDGRVDIAKRCALIAIQEIINSNPTTVHGVSDFRTNIYYWESVKKEIEKL